jgi:hypothetical protein
MVASVKGTVMETVENLIRQVAVSVHGVDSSVENDETISHRPAHTTHGRPLSSLRFTTVPTTSATGKPQPDSYKLTV